MNTLYNITAWILYHVGLDLIYMVNYSIFQASSLLKKICADEAFETQP